MKFQVEYLSLLAILVLQNIFTILGLEKCRSLYSFRELTSHQTAGYVKHSRKRSEGDGFRAYWMMLSNIHGIGLSGLNNSVNLTYSQCVSFTASVNLHMSTPQN